MPVVNTSVPTSVYKGPLLTIYQWEQPLKSGQSMIFERCTRPDTVAVLAFLDPNTVIITEERHVNRTESFLDLPGGRVDAGERHEAAAHRELIEEVGYRAGIMTCWETTSYKGLVQFEQSLFLAKELEPVNQQDFSHDVTEDITVLVRPLDEVYELCLKNQLRRPEAMLAILRMYHDPIAKKRLNAFLSS